MKTDYQNLNAFESSLVAFIAVGMALVGTIIFSGLSFKQQDNILAAINILDIHEQASRPVAVISSVIDTEAEYYDQFYIAFTQVMTMPEATIDDALRWTSNVKVAYKQFLSFSDGITFDYRLQNKYSPQLALAGRVAGVSTGPSGLVQARPVGCKGISPGQPGPPGLDSPSRRGGELKIPYSFVPVQWQPIKEEIIKVWNQ